MSIDARRYSLFGLLSVLGLLGCTSVLVSQSIEWEQFYAEPVASQYGRGNHHVLRMPDGGYVITGSAYDVVTYERAAGMIRTDEKGDVIWTKWIADIDSNLVWPEFAHGFRTEMYPRFSYLREDGKLVYFGEATTVPGTDHGPAYLLVLDDERGGASLDTIAGWYDTTTTLNNFQLVVHRQNGGFLTADNWPYKSEGNGVPDSLGMLVVNSVSSRARYRHDGTDWYQWYRVGTRFEGEMQHYPVTVLSLPDNGLLVWGGYQGIEKIAYMFLLKVDSLGNQEWAWEPDGLSGGVGVARFLDSTADGGFVGVYTVADVDKEEITPDEVGLSIIKFDAEGKTQWTRAYPDVEGRVRPYCIRQAEDGGYVVGGKWGRYDSTGKYLDSTDDFFLLKVDSVGNEEWRKVWGTPGRDRLLYMIPGPNGSMMVSGPAGQDTYFAANNSGHVIRSRGRREIAGSLRDRAEPFA